MKVVHRYIILIVVLLYFSSCVSFTTHDKDRPTVSKEMKAEQKYESLGIVNAESSSFKLLWFIPVTARAKFSLAVEDAIESKGGDNIIKLKYKTKREIWILGLVTIYKISGEVIRYKDE